MTIQRGTQDTKRRAKNYIHKEAQRRLEETIPTFNDQVINSLAVDSVFIDYYHVHDRVGSVCSCRGTEVPKSFNPIEDRVAEIVPSRRDNVESIKLQDDGLFGDSAAERIYRDEGTDVSAPYDYDPEIPDVLFAPLDKEGNVTHQTSILEANVDCGICYRTGLEPGYTKHGTVRSILSAVNVMGMEGVTIDGAATPHHFNRVATDGMAEFELFVPKYFIYATYSVRDNKYLLKNEPLWYNGIRVTDDILRRFAGTKMVVGIRAPAFTHAVVEFYTHDNLIRGNISADQKALDFNLRDMTSNFTIVLPPNIHEVRINDILVIRHRRLVLKVTDCERKITAMSKQLEWVVQTRVVQPQETIKNIYKSFKIG